MLKHRERSMTNFPTAILKVGAGRGFVVKGRWEKSYVITAAHCLPEIRGEKWPDAHPARGIEEVTYRKLLGPLNGEQTVWAELLFLDVIADIAVLGEPDAQADLYQQARDYELTSLGAAFKIADLPPPPKDMEDALSNPRRLASCILWKAAGTRPTSSTLSSFKAASRWFFRSPSHQASPVRRLSMRWGGQFDWPHGSAARGMPAPLVLKSIPRSRKIPA
jgi:hypothetical protein